MISSFLKTITNTSTDTNCGTFASDSLLVAGLIDYRLNAELGIQLAAFGVAFTKRILLAPGSNQIDLLSAIALRKGQEISLPKDCPLSLRLSRPLLSGEKLEALILFDSLVSNSNQIIHGELIDLDKDDHSQYLTLTRINQWFDSLGFEERLAALEGQSSGSGADWRLGDLIWTSASEFGLKERWGNLWASAGIKIGKPGTIASQHLYTDNRLFDLYQLFWAGAEIIPNGGKGATPLSDWNSLKWVQIPSAEDRFLGVSFSRFSKLAGSESVTLAISNLPKHKHGQRTAWDGNLQHEHGGSNAEAAAEATKGKWGISTGEGGGHTGEVGEGKEFSILPPTAYLARNILICAGAA